MKDHNMFDRMHRINRINNEIDALYHTAALRLALSDSAMFVLYMLYDGGGECPLHDIHGAGVCKQTVNSAVRKLEREAVLYLEPYRGKSKLVVLTEKGRALAKQTVARLMDAEERVLSDWTEQELDTFLTLSQRYLEGIRTQLPQL